MFFNNINARDTLEISLVQNNKIVKTFKSKVYDPISPTEILILVPKVQNHFIKLATGPNYHMVTYTNSGIFKFDMELVEYVKINDQRLAKVKLLSGGEKIQRRGYFRHNSNMGFCFFAKQSPSAETYNKKHAYFGRLLDISGGGIRLVSNCELQPNQMISIHIPLKDEYLMSECSVLFADTVPEGIYRHQYRCKFQGMMESDVEMIVKYIFEEQRKIKSAR